jgi:GH18 family chitinase
MTSQTQTSFQIATWYDTWNQTGLNNLVNGIVPLKLASRYNLAFFSLVADPSGGYTLGGAGQYADQVKQQILQQAPSVLVYAGLGSTGIAAGVADNAANQNRSTANIVAWLQSNTYNGISIDAEDAAVMKLVPEFVTQLGPSFRAAGLGIAVSVPWPGSGPTSLYGANAVHALNANVDVFELQDYSSSGTPTDAPVWVQAGIPASKLMGGVATENGNALTSLSDTQTWTQYALKNGLLGMFSWRLDNDHTPPGSPEDVNPTFTGAQTIYDTVNPPGS